MALCPGLPRWAGTRKVKPMWILLKQETVSGSGISWAVCKSAPSSRQIATPAPHHSVFYRPDALPATQPTASKHWRHSTEGTGCWFIRVKFKHACLVHWSLAGQSLVYLASNIQTTANNGHHQLWSASERIRVIPHTQQLRRQKFFHCRSSCVECRAVIQWDSIRHFKKSLTGQVQAVSWPWHCD